jgi:hypothetical protein
MTNIRSGYQICICHPDIENPVIGQNGRSITELVQTSDCDCTQLQKCHNYCNYRVMVLRLSCNQSYWYLIVLHSGRIRMLDFFTLFLSHLKSRHKLNHELINALKNGYNMFFKKITYLTVSYSNPVFRFIKGLSLHFKLNSGQA